MKFIAFNYYNNTSYALSGFETVSEINFFQRRVYITGDGITFFSTEREWGVEERAKFIASLHVLLKKRMGSGFSAVLCAESDCTRDSDFELLFEKIRVFSDIRVPNANIQIGGDKQPLTTHFTPNFLDRDMTTAVTLSAVSPEAKDMLAPKQGWKKYHEELEALYLLAKENAFAPPRPARFKWLQRFSFGKDR
jgi:hypothetical protein